MDPETYVDYPFAQPSPAKQAEQCHARMSEFGTMVRRGPADAGLAIGIGCHILAPPRIMDYHINGGRNLTAGRNEPMEPFVKALEVVTDVMREGAASHPDNDWIGRSPEYHIGRAEEHLRRWREGDQQEDHLSHAVTRLLMALTLRKLA